jgi:hypothetical protein
MAEAPTPVPVFLRHPTNQHLDFGHRSGRPGLRDALPSYFFAISFRCQANKVSGVTIVATRASSLRPCLSFDSKPPAQVIVESHAAIADLLPKNSILLQKILHNLLMLVHPSRNGNDHKLKWVQNGAHA